MYIYTGHLPSTFEADLQSTLPPPFYRLHPFRRPAVPGLDVPTLEGWFGFENLPGHARPLGVCFAICLAHVLDSQPLGAVL